MIWWGKDYDIFGDDEDYSDLDSEDEEIDDTEIEADMALMFSKKGNKEWSRWYKESQIAKAKKKAIPHKDGLIKLYREQRCYEKSIFMRLVLDDALLKLRNDVDPKKVEDWVVDLEKLWRKMI